MLRVLRATVARKSKSHTPFSFSSARKLSSAVPVTETKSGRTSSAPPAAGAPFFFLRNFCSSDSSEILQNGRPGSAFKLSSTAASGMESDEADETLLSGSMIPGARTLEAWGAHQAETHETLLPTCSLSGTEIHRAEVDETCTIQHPSGVSESSLSAGQEEEALPASVLDYVDDDENMKSRDEDEEDLDAESGKDSTSDLNPDSEEACAMDMSNVPEDLKEMLKDDYELESVEEDFSLEGPIELLTLDEVKQVLEDVRARDVQIFHVHDRCEWTDLMVIATGISDRHVRGIADALVYKIKKKGIVESPLYPTIEGQVGGKWLVVDCGNIVIHVLDEESRAYYRLEDLWMGAIRPSTTEEDLETMLRQAGLKDVEP